jgi:LmbE family N-acetylglucosaminyl deacetylase
MVSSPDHPGGAVLMIGAHPDDIDFNAAGCASAWCEQGVDVVWCVVSDGQAGGFDDSVDRTDIPALRRREERDAAAVCGVSEVLFLGWHDGEISDSPALRRELSRAIRRVRPARVLCHSPERDYARIHQCHPDHLAVGAAALAAVYPDARNPYAHPELRQDGLEPHSVPETWLYGGPKPDLLIDVTPYLERKLTALSRHESQQPAREGLLKAASTAGTRWAQRGGLVPGASAEAFQRIDTK